MKGGRPLLPNQANTETLSRRQRPKALALLSGGLDSMLAGKLILNQGINVEAVNFATPFCLCDRCALSGFTEDHRMKVHRMFLGQEFLDIVVDPPHGYGSQMNPCIDCRILMFRKAKELADKDGFDFIVTGEVLNERPFSQRRETMLHIEAEAGLKGRILRPLSAKLLPKSDPEKRGIVQREELLSIRGRRRLPQMELARRLELRDYPCPSGGCLLTDPRFAERLREHLQHERTLTLDDVQLLKLGRHFRIEEVKVIVGRNLEENKRLLTIAKNQRIPWLEAVDYKGPVTLLVGKEKTDILKKAAAITARYSDAPREKPVRVACNSRTRTTVYVSATADQTLEDLRV